MDPRRTLKVHKAAEKFWLGIVIATTVITAYWWYTDGFEERKFAPVMPVLALLWFLLRRGVRKRIERQIEESERSN